MVSRVFSLRAPIVVALVAGLASSACPSSTTSDCETYCSNAGEVMLAYDCSTWCKDLDQLAADSGCDRSYDAFMTCAAGVSDGGAVWNGEACDTQRDAFVQCSAPFCDTRTNLAECESAVPLTGN